MSEQEKDFFRNTWVRYLGYANEVGESFRALVPVKLVRASYGLAFAYVLADTGDKSLKIYKKDGGAKNVILETGDALIWQTLASVAIPGFVINRICKYTGQYLKNNVTKIPPTPRNWLTVAVGLASIPFIVGPIDFSVTVLMNLTYRRWMKP